MDVGRGNDDPARVRTLFRALNDRLVELDEVMGITIGASVVVCECARLDCVERIVLPTDELATLRRDRSLHVVIPSHVDGQTLIAEHDLYALVTIASAHA